MRFVEGCDFLEFGAYLKRLGLYAGEAELDRLKSLLEGGLSHLIVFRENDEIIGHAIWHESNTEEHRTGSPREKEDTEILRGFMGKGRDFVELHELWLTKEHRGKGYGKRFFQFFEDYMERKGYDSIVYYAFDPAAVAICRKRGYKEAYGLKEAGPYGNIETMYTFYLRLGKDARV
jgi:GNAT superfamily N-acetyltransferase